MLFVGLRVSRLASLIGVLGCVIYTVIRTNGWIDPEHVTPKKKGGVCSYS